MTAQNNEPRLSSTSVEALIQIGGDPPIGEVSDEEAIAKPCLFMRFRLYGLGVLFVLILSGGLYYFGLIPGLSPAGKDTQLTADGAVVSKIDSARTPEELAEAILESTVQRKMEAKTATKDKAAASYSADIEDTALGIEFTLERKALVLPDGAAFKSLNITLGIAADRTTAEILLEHAETINQHLTEIVAAQDIEKMNIFTALDAIRMQLKYRLTNEFANLNIRRVNVKTFTVQDS